MSIDTRWLINQSIDLVTLARNHSAIPLAHALSIIYYFFRFSRMNRQRTAGTGVQRKELDWIGPSQKASQYNTASEMYVSLRSVVTSDPNLIVPLGTTEDKSGGVGTFQRGGKFSATLNSSQQEVQR